MQQTREILCIHNALNHPNSLYGASGQFVISSFSHVRGVAGVYALIGVYGAVKLRGLANAN